MNHVARSLLAILLACPCAAMLGCTDARDLDALGVRVPDGGLDDGPRDDAGDPGSSGGAGDGAGNGSSSSGSGNSGRAGSGSGGSAGRAGSGSGFPVGNAGSGSGFPIGAGSGPGMGFPGGGNNPGQQNVAACAPCSSVMGVLGDVPACCTDDDACGVDLSGLGGPSDCQPRDQPGRQTPQCPSIDSQGTMIPGCCRPNGECGIVITRTAPLGCIDPDVIANVIQIDPGQTQRCNP